MRRLSTLVTRRPFPNLSINPGCAKLLAHSPFGCGDRVDSSLDCHRVDFRMEMLSSEQGICVGELPWTLSLKEMEHREELKKPFETLSHLPRHVPGLLLPACLRCRTSETR